MRRPLVLSLTLVVSLAAGAWSAAAAPCVVELAPVQGFQHATAVDVSEGWPPVVVGFSHTGQEQLPWAATVWRLERQRACGSSIQGQRLAALPEYPHSAALGVGDDGDIVGALVADPPEGGIVSRMLAVRWRDGAIVETRPAAPGWPVDPDGATQFTAIASDGAMVGIASGPDTGTRGFLVDGGEGLVLGRLASAWDVSGPRLGRFVVGRHRLGRFGALAHVYGGRARTVLLPPTEGDRSGAHSGAWSAPGRAWVVGEQQGGPVRWEVTMGKPLEVASFAVPLPTGAIGGVAWGVNSAGQVVGFANFPHQDYDPPYRRAFRWSEAGGSVDLNDTVAPSGELDPTDELGLTWAYEVSELGVVVGEALRQDVRTGFAWLPNPPPADISGTLDAPENIDLGDPLPLTIVLTNHEDEVVVVNVCDPGVTTSLVGLTIDPASNPGWSRAEDPQWPMWCQLVNLPPEEPVTLTLVIDVPPEPGRVISNLTIVVQLAEEDPRTVTSEGTTTVGPAIPSVAVTSPASCEDVGPSSSVLVEVETSIPVGDVDLVELVVDGERVAISRGTGTHSMRWVHPGRGLHCAVARATGEGATAESEPVCFEVLGRGPSYRLTILEPPVPDAESEALDINEDGQVAGVGDDRACRWAPDAACLPDPGRAEAIDDSGRTLVGPRRDGTPTGLYVWEADGSVAPVPLGQNTPGEHRRGFDLSNDGLALYELGVAAANVYGLEARDVSTAEVFSGFVTLSPFDVWPDFVSPAVSPNGQWAVMPMPSFLQALSGPTPPYRSAPLLFEVGQPGYGTDVLDPDVWAFAAAVNDHGAIVGFIDSDQIPWYDPSQPFPTRLTEGHLGFSRQAFRWSRDEGLVDLHQLGARSHARDVSNEGVVVGAFQSWVDAQDRAFVYVCDEMEDLNAKIAPDGGWVLRSANAINESGQIAGTASDDLGRRRAFRLDPAP